MDFVSKIKGKAAKLQKSIVFPETFDERTLKAIEIIVQENLAKPILLGKKIEIKKQAEELQLNIDWNKIEFIDLEDQNKIEKYAKKLYEIRKNKGVTLEEAKELLKDRDYFGVMVVQMGDADGMISGATSPTASTIRPALQIIKTKEKFHKVSGIFFMILEKRLLLFADCAINITPNSHDLADIALDTAETAKRFDIEPKVAMLSFSTKGSSNHPSIDKIREAIKIVKDRQPDLLIEGEMQVDTALVPRVAKRKFPESAIQGTANVLIFPNLESGNISYKLVERLAGAKAIGPILQGLKKPVNDLSRGCSTQDIVNLTAITACEAQELKYEIEHQKLPENIRTL